MWAPTYPIVGQAQVDTSRPWRNPWGPNRETHGASYWVAHWRSLHGKVTVLPFEIGAINTHLPTPEKGIRSLAYFLILNIFSLYYFCFFTETLHWLDRWRGVPQIITRGCPFNRSSGRGEDQQPFHACLHVSPLSCHIIFSNPRSS